MERGTSPWRIYGSARFPDAVSGREFLEIEGKLLQVVFFTIQGKPSSCPAIPSRKG
jgi:hypothetical protein